MTSTQLQASEASQCEAASVTVLSAPENAVEMLMPDTINTKTMRIKEGALLPEPVRFESDPWTSLYVAGEIIRELRKAQESKRVGAPATKNDMRKAA
jgi:hypothetical protein